MPTAVVIGAGPAGCVAAVVLARGGWGVTLVEQGRFPRDKVCGECLSAVGVGVLTRLGLAGAVVAAGRTVLGRTVVHDAAGRSASIDLPRPTWGVTRSAMDSVLLDAARDAGAAVLQPARVDGVEPVESGVAVTVRCLVVGERSTLHADRVVVADGRGTIGGNKPPPTGDLGIKAHYEGVDGPPDTIELFAGVGGYAGVAPVEPGPSGGGRWNVACGVPASRVKAMRGDVAAVFDSMCRENPSLGRRMAGSRRASDWLASPLPRFGVRRDWPAGVVPVGNAAAAIDPVGGEGMGLAMASAERAAGRLLAGAIAGDPFDADALRRDYRRLWRVRRPACRSAAWALSSPGVARVAVAVVSVAPVVGRVGARVVGK